MTLALQPVTAAAWRAARGGPHQRTLWELTA